ncbi:MAG: DMT family transporter [Rhodobacteraceae bacterium]|nr:DMT family transporter [Paracoccaceae bacterium]
MTGAAVSARLGRLRQSWRDSSDLPKGVAFMVATTFLFASMDAAAKELTTRYEPFFVVWARYMVQAVGVGILFAPSLGRRLRTGHLRLQIIRSALLFGATIFFFTGFALLPLAQAQALAQTAPLLVIALAALVLREAVGPYRWAGVGVGFLGALVIVNPFNGFDAATGSGLAVLAPVVGALFFAGYSIATRFLRDADNAWTTFIYTGLVGAAAASLAVPYFWQMPELADLPLFMALGGLGGLAQLSLIFAFSYAPASVLAPLLYLTLVWAIVFGFGIFGEVPGPETLAGGALIVAAGLYVHHREQVRARMAAEPPSGD